jgi:hypothetical protein
VLLLLLLLAVAPLVSVPCWGQEPATPGTGAGTAETAYPEVDKFAAATFGKTWHLRGTNSLKRLHSSQEGFAPMGNGGRVGKPYATAFVDVGVVRLDFNGPNTGWYFFSDDLRYVTPATVSTEVVFKLGENQTPAPVQKFPADIQGRVWESEADERNLASVKVRWTGETLEVGVLNPGEKNWLVDKPVPVVAERRVFEVPAPDGSALWFAFSADGKEAWMLKLENVFGGHLPEIPVKAAQTPAQTGKSAQLTDLGNFAADLDAQSEAVRLATVKREMERGKK